MKKHWTIGGGRELSLAFALAFGLAAACPAAVGISDVQAHPRWPWNALVDVDFELSGTAENESYMVELEAFGPSWAGATCKAATFLTSPSVSGDGQHRVVWDLGADCPGLVETNLKVRVSVAPLVPAVPLYMVIDLSGGPQAVSYPVRYSLVPPANILSNDVCRTTELWLRRCPAGTFTMGRGTALHGNNNDGAHLPAHTVRLTKPYWMAIFETTQAQWAQVTGNWPAFFTNASCRATRPVERVSIAMIRGTSGWYADPPAVGEGTFCDLLRKRTGLATVDLPTEAQWERACRAGSTGQYYWPQITSQNVNGYGRTGNSEDQAIDTSRGSARVGSYPANPWGIYDLYGNELELVGDGNPFDRDEDYGTYEYDGETRSYAGDYTEATRVDPRGPPTRGKETYSDMRTGRGADFTMGNDRLNSTYRRTLPPSNAPRQWGFRIVVTGE